MIVKNFIRTVLWLICLSLIAAVLLAQAQAQDFQPQVGQDGKDVIWVPTPQGLVDKMLDMAKVTPKDFVIDLGSGDGRTVITAAKRGAKALGIEYNPDMVSYPSAAPPKKASATKPASSKPIFSRVTSPRHK